MLVVFENSVRLVKSLLFSILETITTAELVWKQCKTCKSIFLINFKKQLQYPEFLSSLKTWLNLWKHFSYHFWKQLQHTNYTQCKESEFNLKRMNSKRLVKIIFLVCFWKSCNILSSCWVWNQCETCKTISLVCFLETFTTSEFSLSLKSVFLLEHK